MNIANQLESLSIINEVLKSKYIKAYSDLLSSGQVKNFDNYIDDIICNAIFAKDSTTNNNIEWNDSTEE